MIRANRDKTFLAVVQILQFLGQNSDQFGDAAEEYKRLPIDRRLQLAMQFYQCGRARMQKAKMIFDVIAHIGPLIISLAALWFATK